MKLVTFITRLSRPDAKLDKIYESISKYFTDDEYYWLVYIEKGTLEVPEFLEKISKTHSNIIVNTEVKRKSSKDKHFNAAISHALTTPQIYSSVYYYILDDDNIIHRNLKTVIKLYKNSYFNLIVNDCDTEDKRIKSPRGLAIKHCICRVDFANVLFSCRFFIDKVKSINDATSVSDGELVESYLKHGCRTVYTNYIAAYYNYLR